MTHDLRSNLMHVGLLVLRLAAPAMMAIGHGWGKLTSFTDRADSFPDPLGVGSTVSMGLAVFAEFFCSILVALGLLTRLAVIPLITTMAVAALMIHRNDPWSDKEMAVLYLVVFVTLLLTGPGRYSIDGLVWKRDSQSAA